MAQKRMFDKDITTSDWFTRMPPTAQLLYFHLGMVADDDGFVANSGIAMALAHAAKDDLTLLCAKRYVIEIEEGLYLIKHWHKNNFLRNDRKKDSPYADRLANFIIRKDGSYTEKPLGIPNDAQMAHKRLPSIEESSVEEISLDKSISVESVVDKVSKGEGVTMEELMKKRDEMRKKRA